MAKKERKTVRHVQINDDKYAINDFCKNTISKKQKIIRIQLRIY